MSLTDRHYDIIIVGSGIVGGALALALALQSWRVAVIEANPNLPQDKRVLALSATSLNIIDSLQLLPLDSCMTSIEAIQVSDAEHFGMTRFVAKDYDLPFFGKTIAAQTLTQVIREKILAEPKISWLCPAELQNLQAAAGGYRLSVKTAMGEKKYSCRLLVAADGNHSMVRRLVNIAVKSYDYREQGIIARVQLARDHKNIAYERFLHEGAIAALPVADRCFAMVWSVPSVRAPALLKLSDKEFLDELQAIWGYRLGRLLGVSERQAFPLSRMSAQEQVRAGLVLLGNSAHTFHPIAAQGLNLALRDMAVLTNQINQAKCNGQNPGSLAVLNKYLHQRKTDQQKTQAFTHGIKRLFSSELLPVVFARNFGLSGLDMLPAMKKLFAIQGMGLSDYPEAG